MEPEPEPVGPVKRLERVAYAAEVLSVSRSKVYQMMDTGELEYVKFGKSRRIAVDAIERLVRRNTIGRDA